MVKETIQYIRENYRTRKVDADPGFGLGQMAGARFISKDGRSNAKRVGVPMWERIDIFHSLINMSWTKFLSIVMVGYLVINFIFACIYWFIGMDSMAGIDTENKRNWFADAYFFSAQTLTTVGYGRISPVGFASSSVAAFESLLGLLGFAVFTGLLYGRFAKPNSKLIYSPAALIAPYREITAFMLQVANPKMNELIEIEAMMIVSMFDKKQNKRIYSTVSLERDKILFLSFSWTIVHPIDENSPLVGLTEADMPEADPEFMVIVKAFDETRSQHIFWRTSYKYTEIVWGAKFLPLSLTVNEKGESLYDISKLGSYTAAKLPY